MKPCKVSSLGLGSKLSFKDKGSFFYQQQHIFFFLLLLFYKTYSNPSSAMSTEAFTQRWKLEFVATYCAFYLLIIWDLPLILSSLFFLNIYLDVAVEVFSTVAPTKRKQLDASYAMAVSRLESDVVCSWKWNLGWNSFNLQLVWMSIFTLSPNPNYYSC